MPPRSNASTSSEYAASECISGSLPSRSNGMQARVNTSAGTPSTPTRFPPGEVKVALLPSLFPAAGRPLPSDVLQNLLSFLRSTDLGGLSLSCRAASSPEAASVLESTVASLVKYRYGIANANLREDDKTWRRDLETLRHAELTHLATLLRNPSPRPGKGYYLSKAWAGNLRRFVEAQARKRRHSPSSSGGKSRSRGRERAESNLMPPWDDVNADLVCQHGGLAHSTQSSRGKRQLVDKRVWRELISFFPKAIAFKADVSECLECQGEASDEQRAWAAVKRAREQEIVLPVLRALYNRKNGVPPASMVPSNGSAAAAATAAAAFAPSRCPLLPGIYHLLPRCWLSAWRSYVRDPRAPSPRPLDTGLFLCEGHGLLLAPPHVEEFLAGERRSLLGGLDPDRSGVVSEILTPEEWDALTLLHPCDFSVRFCVHPEHGEVTYNSRKCQSCDPCYIGELYMRPSSRKLSI